MIGNEMEVGMPHQYSPLALFMIFFRPSGATAAPHAREQELGMQNINLKISNRPKGFL